jgi:predicted Zn-dependent peptidase
MSSRLFQEVREKRGLCYSVYAFGNYFHDSGIIGVYAGTGGRELRELVPVVVGEIEALARNATEEEVARARAQLKASLLMSRESPSARAEQVAADLVAFGRVLSVNELLRRLEAVDAAAIRRFAARLMRRAAPSVAALGPVGALESYDRLAARFG